MTDQMDEYRLPEPTVPVFSLEQQEIVLRAEQGRPSPEAQAMQAGLDAFRLSWDETLALSRKHGNAEGAR